jgi:8-oxo-dGTP pyrophosphatase MutT (NUDIX family)
MLPESSVFAHSYRHSFHIRIPIVEPTAIPVNLKRALWRVCTCARINFDGERAYMNPEHGASIILDWETLERRSGGNYRVFELEWVRRRHPLNGSSAEFVVLHTPVWVNVIPITPEGNVVMVRQFRHGIEAVTLEFPGGIATANEDPRDAAIRECLEETGFSGASDTIEFLGEQLPNPAFMATRCYSFAWYGCMRTTAPRWDEHEIVETVEVPLGDIERLIATGAIQHSINLAAWSLFRLRSTSVEPSWRM